MSAAARWLLALVPSLVLATTYAVLLRPIQGDQLQAIMQQATDEERMLTAQRRTGPSVDLGMRDGATSQRRDELLRQRQQLTQRWCHAASRADTVQRLSSLCSARGVLVERSTAEASDGQDARVPSAARLLARHMATLGGDAPTLWRLDVRCSWRQLTATLGDLDGLEPFALPTGIEIQPAPNPTDFEVSLWLWI